MGFPHDANARGIPPARQSKLDLITRPNHNVCTALRKATLVPLVISEFRAHYRGGVANSAAQLTLMSS